MNNLIDVKLFVRCDGSGRRMLRSLMNWREQQCPVCYKPNIITPGGYHMRHNRPLVDDVLYVWSREHGWVKP